MNRSNSFVSSLKWWPLQGHNNQPVAVAPPTGGGGYSQSAPSSPTSNWPPPLQQHQNPHHGGTPTAHRLMPPTAHKAGGIVGATFGSSVAVQKLRESKWFKPEEQRIFCAVVECGFIVEIRSSAAAEAAAANAAAAAAAAASGDGDVDVDVLEELDCPLTIQPPTPPPTQAKNLSHPPRLVIPRNGSSFLETQDENETPVASWYGIVLCKVAKDNKPKPETIEIFSVKIRENGTYKLIKMSLADIWSHGWELRINNFADKEKVPHNEKDIRNQRSFG
ncbi:uncharacterized protein LOC108097586 isoform X2 [Drosophila ficusphila]|uniref:uncharacterized protein LOC108097586 isoform X2 n=1 Tax=Drosophila ficusphila TaxID=30025 RepID=UPI0007E7B095|nr:uncharacterized protein LOC108097586 isoform X2 [Drosophila ficusphila]XP_017055466.1 uncharacterized protein LOC108097586 isoform X2 [Drosophila ficusphila]